MLFFSCQDSNIEVIEKTDNLEKLPDQRVDSIEVVYTDSTKLVFKVFAPYADFFSKEEEPYMEFPDGIDALFYDSLENVNGRVTSKYAIYYQHKELWEARDSVVAVHKDGRVLTTELLYWDQKKKKIYTDQFVKIVTPPDQVSYGEKGFESDQEFKNPKFKKYKGTITVKDEEN